MPTADLKLNDDLAYHRDECGTDGTYSSKLDVEISYRIVAGRPCEPRLYAVREWQIEVCGKWLRVPSYDTADMWGYFMAVPANRLVVEELIQDDFFGRDAA